MKAQLQLLILCVIVSFLLNCYAASAAHRSETVETLAPALVGTAGSSAPTSFPTVELSNTLIPTYTPTSVIITTAPSASPTVSPSVIITREPSRFPMTTGSLIPTSSPMKVSEAPTPYPSFRPTLYPSFRPTTLSPTTLPTTTPQPTSFPTSTPSSLPSLLPTVTPSGFPTLLPSVTPTALPTPAGQTGSDWWYFVTAKGWLWGLNPPSSKEKLKGLQTSAEAAFLFMLTDGIPEAEASLVHVSVDISTGRSLVAPTIQQQKNKKQSFRSRRVPRVSDEDPGVAPDDDTITVFTRVEVNAWCTKAAIARQMEEKLSEVNSEPLRIVMPLHEQGIYDVKSASIRDVRVSATTAGPPKAEQPLSPDRIIWIILGTVLMFAFGVAFVSRLRSHCQRHPDTLAYLRPKIQFISTLSWDFLCAIADVFRRLFHELRGGQHSHNGFNLAATDEDHDTDTITVLDPRFGGGGGRGRSSGGGGGAFCGAPTASLSITEEAVLSPVHNDDVYFVRKKVAVGDDGLEIWQEIELSSTSANNSIPSPVTTSTAVPVTTATTATAATTAVSPRRVLDDEE